jgi:hypothetical protein
MNQLHNNNRLPHPRSPEEANFAAFRVGGKKVDDFDTGLEVLDGSTLGDKTGCRTMDRVTLRG